MEEGFRLYGNDPKKVTEFIGTRSLSAVHSRMILELQCSKSNLSKIQRERDEANPDTVDARMRLEQRKIWDSD